MACSVASQQEFLKSATAVPPHEDE